jgi:nucleotide-binding universal stress UspA family protein
VYSTLMVILELGRDNASLLRVASELADRYDAEVMGVAACEPLKVVYASGNLPGGIVEMDDAEVEQLLEAAERQFRSALGQHGTRRLSWHASLTDWPSKFVLRQTRCADLILMDQRISDDALERLRYVSTYDVVMEAGRPVIVLPPLVEMLPAKHILVGWRDTREARRAVADAMPLLKRATHVSVVEIAHRDLLGDAGSNVEDVAHWLRRHGVPAHAQAVPATDKHAPEQLRTIAAQEMADLIVAGAYGHSRFREWAFGGVTQDLLLNATVPVLMSH